MKALLPALGLTLSALLPVSAQAVATTTTTWNVTSAEFNITVNPDDYLIDTLGFYGEVGRKLSLSGLQGRLDGSAPGTLRLESEHYDGYSVNRYSLRANYAFDYTLRDYATGEQVASERAIVGIGSTSDFFFETPTGSFSGTTGGATVGGSANVIQSLDHYSPFEPSPLYTDFNASGGYPGDFRLDYRSGALYISLNNGLEHRKFVPDEMVFPPHYYEFSGSLTLTPAIPEPETYALMAMGLAGVALSRRFKRSR